MNLRNPTYVCLDIPDPYREKVREIRRTFCDRLTNFPVEITVAGSSGVGSISVDADWASVEPKLLSVCAKTAPIVARFGGVVRFPGTDTFVLSLGNPIPFQTIHERLKDSGIPFEPSPFPFFPHCSLRMSGELSPADISHLFSLRIEGEFEIEYLALQARDEATGLVGRVWQHRLTGRPE
ncbi:MAG: 2'-5' RNA ligase family protein [Myxococcales bacterium]|nr:2'-5' RNA ligase family protein [Myxococcales bacterium]